MILQNRVNYFLILSRTNEEENINIIKFLNNPNRIFSDFINRKINLGIFSWAAGPVIRICIRFVIKN